MPSYKTTSNILNPKDNSELFDRNWMDRDTPYIPETSNWDYSRELTLDDVDIWEVLCEVGGGKGVYASHRPYAEFYMISVGPDFSLPPKRMDEMLYWPKVIELYYGPVSQKAVYNRAKQLGLFLPVYSGVWVDDSDMWLYSDKL